MEALKSKKAYSNNSGFSYVEMIIALAILSIMVAMITISIGTVHRNTVSRTSEKLESMVNSARTKALTRGSKEGYLCIAPIDGKIYTFVGDVSKLKNGTNFDRDLMLKNGNELCSSSYIVTVSGATTDPSSDDYSELITIQFVQSTGAVKDNADKTVIVKKNNGPTITFNIYGLTGKTWR